MNLSELPRLKFALDMMGLDNGSDVIADATIPPAWEMRARLAEDELLRLTDDDVITLVMGEETDATAVAERAEVSYEVICAAFDSGELSAIVFRPWQGIHDARAAEARGVRQRSRGE